MKNLFKYSFILIFLLTHHFIPNNSFPQKESLRTEKSQVKDSTVKIFFDANASILKEEDRIQASYYRIIIYRNGSIYGPVKDYFINGKPYMIGYYSGNNPAKGYENGKFIYYYETGKIFQIRNYVSGKLEGVSLEFYPSGLKKTSVSYSKGILYGCEYTWDQTGNLIDKGFVENGVMSNRIECDTISDIVKQQTKQEKITSSTLPSGNQSKSTSKPKNTNINNNTQASNQPCEINNTGTYCFTNKTHNNYIVTLYIQGEGSGNYVQISRFDNVSVKWSERLIIGIGESKCFQNLQAITLEYIIVDPMGRISGAARGSITVEKCNSKTYIIE